jgi:hypothetical protein
VRRWISVASVLRIECAPWPARSELQFRVHETTAIQALDCKDRMLPVSPGHHVRFFRFSGLAN